MRRGAVKTGFASGANSTGQNSCSAIIGLAVSAFAPDVAPVDKEPGNEKSVRADRPCVGRFRWIGLVSGLVQSHPAKGRAWNSELSGRHQSVQGDQRPNKG